jgi:multidrug resistance protein, MATE family
MTQSTQFKKHLGYLLHIAWPISLSQFGHVMVGFIDCILAGRIGKVELAVVAVSNNIFFPLLTLLIGFTSGITPIAAFSFGSNDVQGLKNQFRHSFWLNISFAVFMYILILISGNWVISFYSENNLSAATSVFFEIFLFSIIPIVFFQIIKQYAEALGKTRHASFITISGNVLNVVLSFGLVKLYGLNGIAWATLFARMYMAVSIWIIFYFDKSFQVYRIPFRSLFTALDFDLCKKIVSTSLPFGLQMVIESAAFGVAGLMAVKIGIIEGGAHQVALQIASVVYMISTGLGASATVCIGQELGKGNFSNVKSYAKAVIVLMFIYNCITASLLSFAREPLSMMGTQDIEIIHLSMILLLFAASFQFFDGLQVALIGVLRGLNDTTIPTILVSLAYWLVAIPIGYFLAFNMQMGVYGIWSALILGLVLVSLVLYIRMARMLRNLS